MSTAIQDRFAAVTRRTRGRRTLLLAAVAGLAAAALGTTLALRPARGVAAIPAPLPRLLVNGGPHGAYRWRVRPADAWILYTGDGSGRLGGAGGTGLVHPGHLTWKAWTKTQATGSGVVWLYDHVLRTVRKDRATVRASRPVDGHFTRLTIRYTDRGRHFVDTRRVGLMPLLSGYRMGRVTARR